MLSVASVTGEVWLMQLRERGEKHGRHPVPRHVMQDPCISNRGAISRIADYQTTFLPSQ